MFSAFLIAGFALNANATKLECVKSNLMIELDEESCEEYADRASSAEIDSMPILQQIFMTDFERGRIYGFYIGFCEAAGGADNTLDPVIIGG